MQTERSNHAFFESPLTEYLSLPKAIGEVPSGRLFRLAHQALDVTSRRDLDRPRHLTQPTLIAASALVEGVLVETNGAIAASEVYLEILDFVDELYQEVVACEYNKLEEGFNHPDDQIDWLRAELQLAFVDVYRDMACGEVTLDRTKPDITEKLAKLDNQVTSQITSRSAEHAYHKDVVGLHGELAVLIQYWREYKREGETIALPSTYRGGSGHYNARQTHDIVFAYQSTHTTDEGMWKFSTGEVKRGNKYLRLDDLVRYTAPLLQVAYTDDSIRKVA